MSASKRPTDAGGPRPEMQRKRTELQGPRRALIAMLLVVGVAAIAFPVLRLADDAFLGLPDGYLDGASGFGIATLIACSHVIAAVLLVLHRRRARLVAAVAGGIVIGSSVVQVMLMLGVAWFPAVLFFIGFVELLLVAGATPRTEPRRKHVPGRR